LPPRRQSATERTPKNMTTELRSFLESQFVSAKNPIGSHQARKRGLAMRLAKANPKLALLISNEIDSNLEAASEVSGFHTDSCRALAFWLKDWKNAL
jgi:hypothetical protein